MSQGPVQVAGRHAGKKVNVVPNAVPAYQALNQAALAGNHWARLSMFSLRSLSTGRLDKTHIFVRPGPIVTRGVEQFFLALPGCKATMERRSNDEYYLVNLTIDTTYMEMMGTNKATGLYRVVKEEDQFTADFCKDGKLKPSSEDRRFVAITDGNYSDAEKAAGFLAPLIGKVPGAPIGRFLDGYDMHYTHGTGSHGGLRNFKQAAKPLTNEKIHGSAIILAAAMSNAKDKAKITWVSTLGGSAVLTQAMEILAKQNVKLNKHNIYLMEPTTSPTKALQAAYKLGIQPDRDAVKTNILNYMANREQVGLVFSRVRNEKGYTGGNLVSDLVTTSGGVSSLGAAGTTLAGAVGLGVAMPAVPMMLTIGTALGAAAAAFKVGETVVAKAAPHFYHKHIGKIK